jgi:hypothetical protein
MKNVGFLRWISGEFLRQTLRRTSSIVCKKQVPYVTGNTDFKFPFKKYKKDKSFRRVQGFKFLIKTVDLDSQELALI